MSSRLPSRPPGDSDVEIEVVPASARPSKPRRASNPDVDEMIHTGEIDISPRGVPRSMVVRSSASMPKIELGDPEETLITRMPSVLPFAPLRRRSPLIWVAVVLAPVLAAGVAFLIMNDHKPAAATPSSAPSSSSGGARLQATAERLATTLDGAAKFAIERVESIAMAPTLRAGIMTDA